MNIFLNNPLEYKYPNFKEVEQFNFEVVNLPILELEYIHTIILMHNGIEFKDAKNKEDLFWWYQNLCERLLKLNQTHLYLFTHRNRYKTQNKKTELELFNYYSELFYYFFYSARDIIAQIINITEVINNNENQVQSNENFIAKIKDENLKDNFRTFFENTRESYKVIRNAFNHRFNPTIIDNRSCKTVHQINETKIIFDFPKNKNIGNEEINSNILDLRQSLVTFLTYFNKYLDKKYCN
ncbi:hypothetical protein OBK29_15055 [Empedobacter falsenii]|uniref:hypothetical protein n=1 Tax=Empedobacter falsenii TaxID=343874 RepID=UPI003A80B308